MFVWFNRQKYWLDTRITTYINNLHPREEKPLYDLIAKLITVSIPLWDLTLAPIRNGSFFKHKQRIEFTGVQYDPDPIKGPREEWPQQGPSEDYDDFWQRRKEWFRATRKLVLPEPKDIFEPLQPPPSFSLKEKFGNRGLQVIVKLANIQLTPEKQEYHGGSWHVEGQMVCVPFLPFLHKFNLNFDVRTSTSSRRLYIITHAVILRLLRFPSGNNQIQRTQMKWSMTKMNTNGYPRSLDVNETALLYKT